MQAKTETRFAFGENWKKYLNTGFNETALNKSREYLSSFLGTDLKGKTLIDVGSGSGIHSLAAAILGARVTSIDVDDNSVECTRSLAEGNKNYDWKVAKGSIIDDDFVKGLGQYDIVYCWGVAHHTGDMKRALRNLGLLTKRGGLLYVAIYNKVDGRLGSKMWHSIKKFYNSSGSLIKRCLEYGYISIMFMRIVVRFRNPFAEMRSYYEKRGMRWTTDLVDWLGGYPYEYARAEDLFHFYRNMGMELVNLKTTNHIGCNQLVFKKN